MRRFASALVAACGVSPTRAVSLAAQLLWFDSAGASRFGIGTLPGWLDRIRRGEVDARAEGRVASEHAGLAVLEGQGGIGPLVLARAASLASEKARDAGVGLVRVVHLGPAGPAAAVVAEVAVGPKLAVVLGPGASWAFALPSEQGLPVVYDSALAATSESAQGKLQIPAALHPGALFAPWALLAPEGCWLVAAVAVGALEPLATFHERMSESLRSQKELPGLLLPAAWEARRIDARQRGVIVERAAMAELARWAEHLAVAPPAPCAE